MIKPRLVKLAVVEGVDKLVYQNELELKQAGLDFVNLSLTDMVTSQFLDGVTSNALGSLSASQKKQVNNLACLVAQDMLMQRFIASRKRSLVESLVTFGVSEVAQPLLSKATGM